MSEEKSFSFEDFAAGFAGGMIAGAVAAVLFAPSSGTKTRQKIQDWASDTKLSASELVEKIKTRAEGLTQKTEAALGIQEKGLRKKLEQIKNELDHFDLSSGS